MIQDLGTVIWKEWRCLFRGREKRLRTVLTLAAPLLFFGIYMPIETGDRWFTGFPPLLVCFAAPLLMAMLVAPDSFAGERERHTLPTLLASRLPDGAILWGKLGFCFVLSWGLALVSLALGLAVANLASDGGFQLYSLRIGTTAVGLSALFALLSVSLAVPVSLRSSTAQEATQMLAAFLFLPPTLILPVLILVKKYRPTWAPKELIARLDVGVVTIGLVALLVLVDVVLLWWARRLFRRGRLIGR